VSAPELSLPGAATGVARPLCTAALLANAPPSLAPALRFALVSGFISYVVPNFLTFAAIPHLGSGLVAVMFALSPVVTALLSIVLKVRPPSMLGLAGIGVGLVGAIAIIVARNSGLGEGQSTWLLFAALVPVSLGLGNVYRTLAWPRGAGPIRLAALTNLAAAGPLLALAWALNGLDLPALLAVPGLVGLQLLASSLMFLMFFRLQQEGGPTYLSQIGYVAAAVGAGIGVGLLGESYPAGVWAGVAVVAVGIGLSTLAQWHTARA
jgi:drug/metabolite transporter (DMT)-like permease